MIKKALNIIGRFFVKLDKGLLISVAVLSGFSCLLLYAIVQNGLAGTPSMYQTQIYSLCIGVFAALFISALDYNWFVKLWYIYAPIALGLTLLTFTSLGFSPSETVDDKAWIDLGFTTLQPSEVLKIAFILTFALHLDKCKDKINNILNVILLCIHGAIPTLIVVLQGDDGTAIVFFMIFAFMLFSAGISWKYILAVATVSPIAIWIVWDKILLPHQKLRFLVVGAEDPMNDPQFADIFYQQHWGRIALGSGQLFGNGLNYDRYVSVPYVQNDFIFTFVGQCFGFIGCIALVALLAFVCLKIFADSRIAKDNTGKFICVGVFAMIFVHCILNLGMVLVVLPVIGVPLPFVSQGGTSMVSMFISIGLVMSVYSHSEVKYRVFYNGN